MDFQFFSHPVPLEPLRKNQQHLEFYSFNIHIAIHTARNVSINAINSHKRAK